MEFYNTLIHCSSIGKLLTEPVSKADKESGELSKTAKTHLIEVYANKKYGFKCPTGVRGRNSDNKLYFEKMGWLPSQSLKDGIKKTFNWITQVV